MRSLLAIGLKIPGQQVTKRAVASTTVGIRGFRLKDYGSSVAFQILGFAEQSYTYI
jgi:hypothetical protein